MENKNQTISYETLKKDFIIVNGIVGVIVLFTFIGMVLQRLDIIPNMPCIVHDLFRIYCPGCGGTRAIFALLKGHIVESLCSNPAILLGVVLVIYYEAGVLLTLIKKNGKRYYSTSVVPIVVFVMIVMVFAVVRNYLLIACGIDLLQDFLVEP